MPTSRLEAFSDGVFAIAITLLVLEIPVPHAEHGRLAHELLDQWPTYAAYIVSFATIGIIWINHHAVFEHVREADRRLLFLNLGLLMFVTLIPWPTRLIAEFMRSGGSDEQAAAVVYSLTMPLMGISFGALWQHVMRDAPARARERTRRFVIGSPLYAAAIGLAFISAPASLVANALLALFYALPSGGAMAHADGA